MDNLINFMNIIDKPVIIWKYTNKDLYCEDFNDEYDKIFNVEDIDDKNIKNIYEFYSKKIAKNYNKCIKSKTTQSYNIYHGGNKLYNTIMYIDDSHLLEKIDIIKVDNNEILNDPFNMILIVKDKLTIYSANFLFLRNTNYTKTELIDKNINKILTNSVDFNKYNQISNNNIVMNDGKLLNIDYYLIKLNGIYDIIVIKDISIIREKIINTKILKNLDTSIVIFDKNDEYFESYKCVDANNAFYNKFIEKDTDILNHNIIDIFDEKIYFKLKKIYSQILSNNNYTLENIEFKHKYYNFNCFMIEDHLFGIIIIDITNSVKIKSLKYAKDNFLVGIIDKIRTPIQNISNAISLLSESELDIVQYEYINRIMEHNYILSSLMSDFTDYANLKLHKLDINEEPFNLREEINQCYENILIKAKDKHIEFIYDIDSNIPPYIIGDKYRFNQILLNLLSNALKFTDKGKIELKIYSDNIKNDNYELYIIVSDTGIGIDKKYLTKIFDSFYQIDLPNQSYKKGSGLGLSICKYLCELMNGKISVESKINIGSTFKVVIPVKEFTDIDKIEEQSVDMFKGKTILIIDENSINRVAISKLLLDWKVKSYMASTSEESLFLIKNNHFDACFIDIDSSNTSGCEIAKVIKEHNRFIQVIAMSSFENRQYEKNVFDYLIIKQITKQRLLKLFINIFSDRDMNEKNLSTGDVKIFNNISILILNNLNNNIVKILNKLGYTNVGYTDDNTPDDINKYEILFVNLMSKNSRNFIKKIKKNGVKPYIIGTTNDRKRKYEKIVDAVISTPIDSNELKALLKVISRRLT